MRQVEGAGSTIRKSGESYARARRSWWWGGSEQQLLVPKWKRAKIISSARFPPLGCAPSVARTSC